MTYSEKITTLIEKINKNIVDLRVARQRSKPPTQAYSDFLTNKEQGDWAEHTLLKAINNKSSKYIAIKYGRTDDLIAGEEGFVDFYEFYQDELDTIGKRPDILIFDKNDYASEWGFDISKKDKRELDLIVPNAKAGLEIRSSSFLIDKYETYMLKRTQDAIKNIFDIKSIILGDYKDILKEKQKGWIDLLENLSEENLSLVEFRVPSWRTTERYQQLSELFKKLKSELSDLHERDFLSITPKVEDLKVVYKWVLSYNVPHFYIQVFFDKAYGISFEYILELLIDSSRESKDYYIESGDEKNQNKTTIKINTKIGEEIIGKIEMPAHYSHMRELGRGKLLFYVKFKNSIAYLVKDKLNKLLGFDII